MDIMILALGGVFIIGLFVIKWFVGEIWARLGIVRVKYW